MKTSFFVVIAAAAGFSLLSNCQPGSPAPEAAAPVSQESSSSPQPAAQASPAAQPAAIAAPAAGTIPITVVADKRCTDPSCDTKQFLGSLRVMIPGAVITELDWGTPEGKAAYTDHGLKFLPAYIFDNSLQSVPDASKRLARMLKPSLKPGFQVMQMRATHDPTKEICDNKLDDTANGKTDCEDDDCTNSLVCRPEIKGDVQVFVMSQCPYGTKALDAMQEVLKAFGGEIKFDVHYIANEDGAGFKALHGQPEVDENIRQLCAKKLSPNDYKWMEYIWCRDKDIKSSAYESCVTAAGIDLPAFNACASGDEGKQLLRQDIKLAQALGIGGSPTWLANNRAKFSGIDPKAIQTGICQANPEFSGCKAQVSGPAPRQGGGGGGCGCGGGGGGGGSCGAK